jgi:excisionase family DNA binding protein
MGMAEEQMSLLKARDAARYLNVSLATLDRIEKERRLKPFRTPGGHRRYSLAMLNEYLERSRQRYRSASLPMKHAKDVPGDKPQNGVVRVLVVGNEPDTVERIVGALRADSDAYEFASASNGYEVGVQVVVFKPDLIVLSVGEPEAEGFEVCEKIKGDPKTQYIRIVSIVGFTEDRPFGPSAVSGATLRAGLAQEEPRRSAQDRTMKEMLRRGADDCLIKPFQIEELQRSVRHLTSRKAAVGRASS